MTLLACCSAAGQAQSPATVYPLGSYAEPQLDEAYNAEPWTQLDDPGRLRFAWTSKDVHHPKREVPATCPGDTAHVKAWRGERVGLEAVVFSAAPVDKQLRLAMSSWRNAATGAEVADASNGQGRFMRYVITDDFRSCGAHDFTLPPRLVADVIDTDSINGHEARTTRPVWCTLEVPRNLAAGTYETTMTLLADGQPADSLTVSIDVADRTLPEPSRQHFHLDLWQQPYAIARYHGVKPWSPEHFEAMRPYMESLARAGQKVVSAILFYEPWGDQSHDKFEPMIQTIKGADGTWRYDYTVFDRYVEMMEQCGIGEQVNCFSMIPWDMSFRYFDEKSGKYEYLTTQTSTAEYRELWTAFLTSFADHLRSTGRFDKTCIAMDERGLPAMLDAYNLLTETVPDMKMALAGNYHTELADKLYDYCVTKNPKFTAEELADRKAKGYKTTFYTCCADPMPNIFSNSDPADAVYLPLHAAANDLDGYLHWSWVNWDEHPLTDTRFRLFGSGDTYLFYPGNRSSLRFERLIEGIQQYEKVRILRGEKTSDPTLEAALAKFRNTAELTPENSTSKLVNELKNVVGHIE